MALAGQEDRLVPASELSEALRSMQTLVAEWEGCEGPTPERDRERVQRRLQEGRPLLQGETVRIHSAAAEKVFGLLVNVCREHLPEKTKDWERLERGLRREGIPAGALLDATLQHRWDALQAWAAAFAADREALQFFSIYLARPFRQQAARHLWDQTQTTFWQEGYCPVCGHSPVLGRLVGAPGQRRLWCCCCGTSWSFSRIGCPFCKCQSPDQLGYLTVNEFPSYRIYVCDVCKRYLKTIVCPEESETDDWDYDRDYFATAALDPISLREGYIAEPVWLARGELSDDSRVGLAPPERM
jgi:formate dehydrogenase maturation protein FdhE